MRIIFIRRFRADKLRYNVIKALSDEKTELCRVYPRSFSRLLIGGTK